MHHLIIQLSAKQDKIAEVFRSKHTQQQDKISIGRAYTNDLMITDHYVAGQQVELVKRDDAWFLVQLDFTNKIKINGRYLDLTQTEQQIFCGDKITLGRTSFYIHDEEYQVAPPQKLLSTWFNSDSLGILIPIFSFVLFCALAMMQSYYSEIEQQTAKSLGTIALGLIVVTLFWAGIWSFIGKLLRHQTSFFTHVFIVSFTGIISLPFEAIQSYTDYILSNTHAADIIYYILNTLILFWTLKLTLFFATNIKHTNRVSAIVLASITAMIFGFTLLDSEKKYSQLADYSQTVKPPFASITSGQTLENFMLENDKILVNLQEEVEQKLNDELAEDLNKELDAGLNSESQQGQIEKQ